MIHPPSSLLLYLAAPLYLPSMVKTAWLQFFDSCRMSSEVLMPQITPSSQTANPALDEWMAAAENLVRCSRAYREAKEVIDLKHESMVWELASKHHYSLEQIVLSPTLTRHVNAFASDLQVIDSGVWASITPLVLQEIRQRVPVGNAKIACPFCANRGRARLYLGWALKLHVASSHPERLAEQMILSKVKCSFCPRSNHTYDRDALISHLKNSLWGFRTFRLEVRPNCSANSHF
ncbi:hypothetical protein DFH09DRAFT_540868 [Mycena vulgaris]|nr:hypothetical protein DFH09DRAFT_540868 [Mycena vulgaris]